MPISSTVTYPFYFLQSILIDCISSYLKAMEKYSQFRDRGNFELKEPKAHLSQTLIHLLA